MMGPMRVEPFGMRGWISDYRRRPPRGGVCGNGHRPCPFCWEEPSMITSRDSTGTSWAHALCPNCFAEGPHVLIGDSFSDGYEGYMALHAAEERAWELWDGWAGGAQVEAEPPHVDAMQMELDFGGGEG